MSDTNPTSLPSKAENTNAKDSQNYELKKIQFFGRLLPIVLQNANGPCPLIAIANILLLRGKITLSTDYSQISQGDLIQLVANHLLEVNNQQKSGELRLDFEKNINDSIAILPNMQFGLDVNLKFTGIKDFEYTHECIIFDLLDIDLVHGWLPHPSDEIYKLLENLSYNQVLEKLIDFNQFKEKEKSNSIDKVDPNHSVNEIQFQESPVYQNKELKEEQNISEESKSTKIVKEGNLIQNWMNQNASQLTYHGLYELHSKLKENQLCVFFRNNHFSTLFKNKNELFVLLTDAGYLHEPIVWEKLDQVDNDTILCGSNFQKYSGPSMVPSIVTDAVSAVSESLSKLINNESTPNADQQGDLILSPEEVQQQLLIEENIQQEKKSKSEEKDRQLAIQLHNEEVTNTKNSQKKTTKEKRKGR